MAINDLSNHAQGIARRTADALRSRRGHSGRSSARAASGRNANKSSMQIYQEMLDDAASSSRQEGPRKRRKTAKGMKPVADEPSTDEALTPITSDFDDLFTTPEPEDGGMMQTIFTDGTEESDDDEDFEDVDLEPSMEIDEKPKPASTTNGSLTIDMKENEFNKPRPRPRRKRPGTTASKDQRIFTHKLYLLSLLFHVHLRNYWCNDEKVHMTLSATLDPNTISYLNPNTDLSQFQRNRSFIDGLKQAIQAFNLKYKIDSYGIARPRWAESKEQLADFQFPARLEELYDLNDFRTATQKFRGSQDTGAMLFCAMLRSVGVDARLVASLQPLSFANASAPTASPQKARGNVIYADQSSPNAKRKSKRSKSSSRKFIPRDIDSMPFYWVEAFNEATQKWICVEPLLFGERSINKPSMFEPSLVHPGNTLSYVIGFEDDLTAVDVTRRYSSVYLSKTRKLRVEATEGGQKWWRRTMRAFRRKGKLDRDDIEEAELAKRVAREGMPKNIQDFKDHPYYALERHLKRHEIIHPRREVGKVSAGKNGLETVFRREDVMLVQTADRWYRAGRVVKSGEQPLKHVKARNANAKNPDEPNGATDALFGEHQTEFYVADPVIGGRIPKNQFGNLDVYKPWMVPIGAVHIRDTEARRAARILGIEYADAVIGFKFEGRRGTAVTQGVVVLAENADAMNAVLQGLKDLQADEIERNRSTVALRLWKRFLTYLRILERVNDYEIDGEKGGVVSHDDLDADEEDVSVRDFGDEVGGGFLHDLDADAEVVPTAGPATRRRLRLNAPIQDEEEESAGDQEKSEGGSFLQNEQDGGFLVDGQGGGFVPDEQERGFIADGEGGGFVPDEQEGGFIHDDQDGGGLFHDDESGGGFIPDEEPQEESNDGADEKLLPTRNSPVPKSVVTEPANAVKDIEENRIGDTTSPCMRIEQEPGSEHSEQDHESEHPVQTNAASPSQDVPKGDADITHDQSAKAQNADPDLPNAALIPTMSPPTRSPEKPESHEEKHANGTEMEDSSEPQSTPGSESDRGSLISHDPEDDDADPEWLVDI